MGLKMVRAGVVFGVLMLLLTGAGLQAQPEPEPSAAEVDTVPATPVAPATNLQINDHKYDDANALEVSFDLSPDDYPGGPLMRYEIYRADDGGEPSLVATLIPGIGFFLDEGVEGGHTYAYQVVAHSRDTSAATAMTGPVQPQREWLDLDRGWLFLIALIIGASVIYFIQSAKSGKELFIRKIAGLEAVDEAIGRATEMGRPILYIPGILDMDDVQTLASITILGRVAHTIADYDIQIRMPVSRSLVMTAARETIKAAYQTAGRPDAYSDDMVNYVTDEQFGYVAAVDGIMVREKPATVFLLGAFFAESLILAETGNSINAIQIAGTARPAQLPFFIAACDFTLIGEELFAASAYLSGEPKALGSLKGQDVGKGIAMVIIIIGVIAATTATAWEVGFMQDILDALNFVFTTK